MINYMQREKSSDQKGTEGRASVRIALVDDDQSIHQAMHCLFKELAKDWRLDSYLDGQQALQSMRAHQPNAVLMDILMPGISGVECASKLRLLFPNVPIVMFSARTDAEAVMNAMMAGACGYVTKPSSADKILVALKQAIQGSMVLCPTAEKAMLDGLHSLGRNSATTPLTHREKEIMTCVCRRLSNKEIAEFLGISAATVHAHLAKIFKKLDAHTRAEAIRHYLGEHKDLSLKVKQ